MCNDIMFFVGGIKVMNGHMTIHMIVIGIVIVAVITAIVQNIIEIEVVKEDVDTIIIAWNQCYINTNHHYPPVIVTVIVSCRYN